ncbi:MAG: helix-turn-helix transcriptional regulator [Clostridia bacterium]|nr:helix-turn-helix transcriptional regulator [Clostridia bacterium]
MNFSTNLKALRKEKEMGQEELAQILKISVKTISHWETGYTEPSILQLCQLADIFETSIDELVGRIF